MSWRDMNPHSLDAYHEQVHAFSRRETVIFCHLLDNPGSTDRQVKDALFGPASDMNTVRPRINELIDAGWIRVCGERHCPLTGKLVRVLEAVTAEERAQAEAGEPQMQLAL